jgi:hypothetical protein
MKALSQDLIPAVLLDPSTAITWSIPVWESAILILREEKLLATLYHLSNQQNVYSSYPKFAQRHLLSASIYADRQAKQIYYEATLLTELLSKSGITPIYLKGANYALRISNNSRGRICSDIDVLVKKDQINQTEALLIEQNWQSETLTEYDQKYYREWAHEIPPLMHPFRGTVLDVHHNLYLPISGRSPDIELFLSELDYTEDDLALLKLPQTLLHSIIHLFMNEDFSNGLRDLFDIYGLINQHSNEVFWDELFGLAEKTNFVVELQYCLVALKVIFQYEAPSSIKNKLETYPLSAIQKLWAEHVFINAILPQHPLTVQSKQKLCASLAYFRGHWLKMPVTVLFKHFIVKTYKQLLDQVLGKHQLDPK